MSEGLVNLVARALHSVFDLDTVYAILSLSDHFLVEANVVVAKEWGNRVVGCRRVVKVEELKIPKKAQ